MANYNLDFTGSQINTLLNALLGVGAIFTTADTSLNPNSIFGGTWVLKAEKMPIGENVFGNGKNIGLTDGSNLMGTYGYVINGMGTICASHDNFANNVGQGPGNDSQLTLTCGVPTKAQLGQNPEYSGLVMEALTVNIWQRTA